MPDETFLGYAFLEPDGNYLHPVYLSGEEAAVAWALKWGAIFPEVRLCDGGDEVVVQTINGALVHPLKSGEATRQLQDASLASLGAVKAAVARGMIARAVDAKLSPSVRHTAVTVLESLVGVSED